MKRVKIFEDSAPFSLVIKQSVQENTSSEQQPFNWGPRFHIGCMGLGRIQHLEPKQSVMIKPLSSYRPYGRWNRNQVALVPCMKPDKHSSQKQNLDNSRFQHNVCFQSKSYQNCFWPWNKKAKNMSVRNNTLQDRLSTIITLREYGNMRESGRGSLTRAPHSGL